MTRFDCCSVCLAKEDKIVIAGWNRKVFNPSGAKIRIDLCKDHKEQKFTFDEACMIELEASEKINKMLAEVQKRK